MSLRSKSSSVGYVLDVFRARLSPAKLEDAVMQMAGIDGATCRIRIPQDPGAGKFVAYQLVKKLIGYDALPSPNRRQRHCAPLPLPPLVSTVWSCWPRAIGITISSRNCAPSPTARTTTRSMQCVLRSAHACGGRPGAWSAPRARRSRGGAENRR
jgi:hypothetical protein